MRLADLQQALQKVSPAAVLVTPQVLDKVIQQVCRISGLPWSIPHRFSYVVDRQLLFRHIEQEDLDLNPEYLLPPRVILLLRPTAEQLQERPETLYEQYWRRLFHATIHLQLEEKWQEDLLNSEIVRNRIREIGAYQFAEIRLVLEEDQYLQAGAEDHAAWFEFCAVYLEMAYFSANLLPIYFPGLPERGRVEKILGQDLAQADIFARTRLDGASDPEMIQDTSSDESHDYFHRLIRQSDRTAETGNLVRAAILRTKAARVAPAHETDTTRAMAEADIARLAARLSKALEMEPGKEEEWALNLNSLIDKADQGTRPVEADLLFDLQKVCLDAEEGVHTLSLLDYIFSLGRRPFKRPLPCLRQVRILSHLRQAMQRLTMARISDAERSQLGGLLQGSLRQGEERLRVRFRPILEVALHDVGVEPANAPERVAFSKIIEELLDRIVSGGYLTFSDLRDVISHNEIKIPDLQDPQEFMRGDPVLRLDRRLASLLDGVYRRSEIYSRLLERLTALCFGTPVGRWLVVWLLLPFGGAFVLLEGCKMLGEEILGHELIRGDFKDTPQLAAPLPPLLSPLVDHFLWIGLSLLFLGLWHSQRFRDGLGTFLVDSWRILSYVFFTLPMEICRLPLLVSLLNSWAFQLFSWIVLKPGLVFGTLWLLIPQIRHNRVLCGLIYLALIGLVNSSPGKVLFQTATNAIGYFSRTLSLGLIKGLFNLIVAIFKRILGLVEDLLFTVDEWMRFRPNENIFWISMRVLLGILWVPIGFLLRFYMVVLIEPGINPLKFPVSTVAAKFLLPLGPVLIPFFVSSLTPIIGGLLAGLLVGSTFWLLPDAFGYLFWELKENWGLYRANRSSTVKPMSIGSHGETMLGLLQPGFHSGTVPRMFARWRKAEKDAIRTRNWRVARRYRVEHEELQETVHLFVQRNLVNLLEQSEAWKDTPIEVGEVAFSASRIQVELIHPLFREFPVVIVFQENEGWLIARFTMPGWLEKLEKQQSEPLKIALLYLFKLIGVSLVHEQIRSQLPQQAGDFAIRAQYLETIDQQGIHQKHRYDWREYRGQLIPHPDNVPPLDAAKTVFWLTSLPWDVFVQWWENEDSQDHHHPNPFPGISIDLVQVAISAGGSGKGSNG